MLLRYGQDDLAEMGAGLHGCVRLSHVRERHHVVDKGLERAVGKERHYFRYETRRYRRFLIDRPGSKYGTDDSLTFDHQSREIDFSRRAAHHTDDHEATRNGQCFEVRC